MIEDPKYIEELVYKFQKGIISPEELAVLTDWYNSHDDGHVIVPVDNEVNPAQIKERVIGGLLTKVEKDKSSARSLPMKTFRWIAAAMILFMFFVGWFAWKYSSTEKVQQQSVVDTAIEPGGNKATLTLADGRTIDLSAEQEGIVVRDNHITYQNGIDAVANLTSGSTDQLVLSTPRGGQYRITLPDGTHVWLNAASSISYPASFAGAKERRVEIKGEAYLEVARDEQRPFFVVMDRQTVEVLGTHFNVTDYPGESKVKTTLLKGKVAVASQGETKYLLPGMQSIVTGDSFRVKEDADVNRSIAWTKGLFDFEGASLEEVLGELSRWYDVQVEYNRQLSKKEFVGSIDRNLSLSQVLQGLEAMGTHLRLENRTLKVGY